MSYYKNTYRSTTAITMELINRYMLPVMALTMLLVLTLGDYSGKIALDAKNNYI